jgi:hypothetical protein
VLGGSKMIIVTEKRTPKQEAGNSKWDITWSEALGVFKILSGSKGGGLPFLK